MSILRGIRDADPSRFRLEMLRRGGGIVGASHLRLLGLSEFPPEVFGLADTLELLDVGGGALSGLPLTGAGTLSRRATPRGTSPDVEPVLLEGATTVLK
jgi:hypothetical protein